MASNQFQANTELDGVEPLKRQGSLRRVLPPSANGEPVVGMSAKMIERPRPNNTNSNSFKQNYSQYFQEYSLIAEYNMLVNHRLPGLYVMPSANSALVWFCVIFVRKGLYQGGIFRFNLLIPEDFPNCSSPQVVFESKVFHPSIDAETGEMEVKSVFPEWKDVNRLWQMLDHVVHTFCTIDTKNALNTEAAQLYENSQEKFIQKVNECVDLSQITIYSPSIIEDAHYIKFDQYNSEIHDKVLTALTDQKETVKPAVVQSMSWVQDRTASSSPQTQTAVQGLSWVQFGSLEPFSATHS